MNRPDPRVHRILAALVLLSGGAGIALAGCSDLAAECRDGNCLGTGGGSSSTGTATGGAGGVGGQGGASTSSAGGGGAGGSTPASCDPRLTSDAVADSCGIFVSSTKGSDSAQAEGTKTKPYASIAKAVQKAADSGATAIYLCGEKFEESVVLNAGIDVYGGLDCANGWKPKAGLKTSLHGKADTIALRVLGSNKSTVRSVSIVGANATVAGMSSIAMLVSEAAVELDDAEIMAGNGAAGATGASEAMTAKSGTKGVTGKTGCVSGATVLSDDGPMTTCDDGTLSIGGKGGLGERFDGGSGQGGSAVPAVMNPNGGAGQLTSGTECKNGTAGLNGAAGTPGDGAVGLGSLDATTGFVGVEGGAGKSRGKPGQGGGGGGGSSGTKACTTTTNAGGSGGSGGSGGCGGAPAKGGLSGGSSIALVSLNAQVTLKNSVVTAKNGGQGGQGGDGQPGGLGFGGGAGGQSNITDACGGGKGGDGGRGGAGGGGLGGHSVGLAYTGTAPTVDSMTVTIAVGESGLGGLGGDGGMNSVGGTGAKGVAVPTQSFDGT